MSGLALLLRSMGCSVTGSDLSMDNAEVQKLKVQGIRVNHKHSAENIEQDIDMLVYTSAVKEDNPELIRARELGIPCLERAELLGLISLKYSNVIAISGTHGKTTTTAMLGEIFVRAGLQPTIHLGGVSVNLGSNTVVGGREYLILEACEYCDSFRFIPSDTAIITNIETDHLDYYKDLEDIYSSFQHFAEIAKSVVVGDKCHILHSNILIIGKSWSAKNIRFSNFGYDYDVYREGVFWGSFRLNLLGEYNITNSLFAIAVAEKYGIEKRLIIEAIARFRGVERRQEIIHNLLGVPIVIDYAHHPTEIKASIGAIRQVYDNPLIVFQPHTYSRTISLFDDFVDVLKMEKNLVLFSTYPARESEVVGGRAEDLAEALPQSSFIDSVSEITEKIEQEIYEHNIDVVLILGAGDLAEKLKCCYRQKPL